MTTESGPVESEVRGTSYPAGPGWWIAADHKWYPPPEPAEPPGTVHTVGEQKPTWQGMATWSGTAWVVAPSADGTDDPYAQSVAAQSQYHDETPYQANPSAYVKPPTSIDASSIRVLNWVVLVIGSVSLLWSVGLLVAVLAKQVTGSGEAAVLLSLFALFPMIPWVMFLAWINGSVRKAQFGRRRLRLGDLVGLMAPISKPIWIVLSAVAVIPIFTSGAISHGSTNADSPTRFFAVWLFVVIFFTSAFVGVMLGEVLRLREARSAATS
jgi:hypothetical protein